jgi:M6 family metalloprotease-like protein
MFGEHYGVRPPAGYYETLRSDPTAFRFKRGFRPTLRPVAGGGPGRARVLGPRSGPVLGTFTFPMILGLYSDSPVPADPFTRDIIHGRYFNGVNPDGLTLTEFFNETSSGRITLTAQTMDWTRSSQSRATVAGSSNGLSRSDGVYEFITDLLGTLDDGSIDWGQFDNDGPDGVPNSGDDDGFVDMVAVMHPTSGAECTNDDGDVWSHFWALSSASSGGQPGVFVTQSAASGGGTISIDDYVIVPSRDCDGADVNEVGTLAHELGHGFGLPDLYAVGGTHAGIGRWGLMGSGSWGCSGASPAKPCQMIAWTKEALGWVDVTTLAADTDHGVLTLDPVQTSNRVFRVNAGDGSGDYYLIENRQAIGSDSDVPAPGLLIWRVDAEQVDDRWTGNRVNSTRTRMGVWLQQADGSDHLARPGLGRGDAGDPYPGSSGNDAFHASTDPAARSHLSSASGLTLFDLVQTGQQISFRLLTRYQTLTLRADGGQPGDFFTVDGAGTVGSQVVVNSAPFQQHTIEAVGGQETETGFRNAFISWDDGAPRIRAWQTQLQDAALVATYGTSEVRLDISIDGPVPQLTPGTIVTDPPSDQGWIRVGQDVTVLASPNTGFGFVEWTGALAGRPNPFVLNTTQPSTGGASFAVTMGATTPVEAVSFEAATAQVVVFESQNANAPVVWTLAQGVLPHGMFFDNANARLNGSANETGNFPLVIRATDAIGLTAEVSIILSVSRPSAGLLQMAAPFIGTGTPSAELRTFLDYQGNRNGSYDLADFRMYVLSNPDAPRQALELQTPDPIRIPLLMRREGSR